MLLKGSSLVLVQADELLMKCNEALRRSDRILTGCDTVLDLVDVLLRSPDLVLVITCMVLISNGESLNRISKALKTIDKEILSGYTVRKVSDIFRRPFYKLRDCIYRLLKWGARQEKRCDIVHMGANSVLRITVAFMKTCYTALLSVYHLLNLFDRYLMNRAWRS